MAYYESADAPAHTVETGAYTYKIKLVPAAYFALQQANGDGGINKTAFQKRLQQVEGNTYFIMQIQHANAASATPEEKTKAISYYELYAAKQFSLSDGTHTLQPAYVHFEDSYGMSPYDKLLICFNYPLKDMNGSLNLSYNDILLGNPDIHVSFSKKDIDNSPVLKF